MNKWIKEDPFIVDPLIMIYGVSFFLIWYIKFRDRSESDLRLLDVLLALSAYLYITFVGFFK